MAPSSGRHGWRSRGRAAALACMLVVSSVFIASPVAAKCQPGRADNGVAYHAGGNRVLTGIRGTSSSILNYSPWVQPGSEVSAWVMLTKSTDHRWWAQVGWWENPNAARYTFTQHTDQPGHWYTFFKSPAEPVNTYTNYKVQLNSAGSLFWFYLNGAAIDSGAANFVPNEAQAFGETHTLADQMPGHSGGVEWFTSMKVLSGGVWSNFNATVWTTNNTYFRSVKNNSTTIYIYDRWC